MLRISLLIQCCVFVLQLLMGIECEDIVFSLQQSQVSHLTYRGYGYIVLLTFCLHVVVYTELNHHIIVHTAFKLFFVALCMLFNQQLVVNLSSF